MTDKVYFVGFDSMYDADLTDDKIRSLYTKHSTIMESSRWMPRPKSFNGTYEDWKNRCEKEDPEDLRREWPAWDAFNIAVGKELFLYLCELHLSKNGVNFSFRLISVVEEIE